MDRFLSIVYFFVSLPFKLLNGLRVVLANLVFLLLIVLVLLALNGPPQAEIPDGAALVLNPTGDVVEKRTLLEPLARYLHDLDLFQEETLFQDLLDAVNLAADDQRIKVLVLDTARMRGIDFNQLRDLAGAVDGFQAKGKKVIAMAESYSQGQYYLAAHGDEVYLHPMGMVLLKGFGVYRLYLKEMLDKLNVDFHVFRVGEYKSALEPFLRNDMSADDREANQVWLERLWRFYCDDLAIQRGLDDTALDDLLNNLADKLAVVDGDPARLALENRLIDGIKSGPEFEKHLVSLVGEDTGERGYRNIEFLDYLQVSNRSYEQPLMAAKEPTANHVGIIVAEGDVVHGDGGPGLIGSSNLVALLRKARQDESVKAVVLRLNTGGGSAMASELIREELALVREQGKPVVVSMGSLAASGGYWIAAAADRILASPVTLTGSIGIFGAVPTIDQALAEAGIHSDGIGTTDLAAGLDPTRPLPEEMQQALQLSIENGYARFLSVVADGREMAIDEVEAVAGGRVWDGQSALEMRLVDELGSLADAVGIAAELSGLTDYAAVYVLPDLGLRDELLAGLGHWGARLALDLLPGSLAMLATEHGDKAPWPFLLRPDPGRVYAHSLIGRRAMPD